MLVASGAASLLALLLGFVTDLTVVGGLRHARDQQVRYAELRSDLANAVAPVGPADEAGTPYPPGTAMALLEIPAINLREVVVQGTTAGVLRGGPGHRRDTPLPGQAGTSVVLGRRAAYGGPFRRLDQLIPGDQVTVTTGQGVHAFKVIDVRRAGDPEPPGLPAGHGRLTLVTAAGSPYLPTGVLRVDADLMSAVQPSPPPRPAPGLTGAEQTMAADPSVWVPLVLWGQALLAAAALVWARIRWGRWQVWVVGVPVPGALGVAVADQVAGLLPNLL
ncbi:MAG TPA: class E sortase [Mycobacteriales bacterium]|nr:class E sortase [Mycobacteriales bacterium]